MITAFKELKKHEWIIWITSVCVVLMSAIPVKNPEPLSVFASVIGVTALIFVAKGNVLGQVLTVVFSVLYGINALKFRYFGELITYVFMTLPIAVLSIITWLRHPYVKGKNEVKIHKLTKKQTLLMIILAILVTLIFYFVLKSLGTSNLKVSTLSITTSFVASYLLMYRNSYYAVAYAANDVVLIILWIYASFYDISYLPLVACFLMFLVNDIYGFINWKKREKKQQANIYD